MDATTQPPTQIEADDHLETDSGLGDDAASSTASLASSVLNYQYENGRRYHAFRSGQYFLPNDEQEQERLDFTHHILTMLLEGKLYRAPLSDPKQILDVGTGTGYVTPCISLVSSHLMDKYPNESSVLSPPVRRVPYSCVTESGLWISPTYFPMQK